MAKRSTEYLEEFSARLRAAMAARGLSQADLARLLVRVPSEARKVSSAVSRWCKAEHAPDPETMPRLAAVLGVSLDFLLTGNERTPVVTVLDKDARPVPLVGSAAAGEPLMKIRDTKDIEWAHFAPLFLRKLYGAMPDLERAVMLRVEGDSMAPDLIDGGIVFLDRGPKARGVTVEEIRPDGIYAVRFPDSEGVTLKRVSRTADSLVIEARNPDRKRFPTRILKMDGSAVPNVVLGRVVGKMEPV